MDEQIVKRYRFKKYLKISLLTLLTTLFLLLVYGYIRILPHDIMYTNISSSSFTVSWTTSSPTAGAAIVVSEKNIIPFNISLINKSISSDTRDITKAELASTQQTAQNTWEDDSFGVSIDSFVTELNITERGKYYTHHVEVKGLDSESEYRVMIGDGLLYINPFLFSDIDSIKTDIIADTIKTPVPAYGSIKDAKGVEITDVSELVSITDGIVYFNYLDKETNKRSNIFSSSLNENGNWYMDLSNSTDDEGNPFYETYSSVKENVVVELIIEASDSGRWKSIYNPSKMTPFPNIVLNLPNTIEDQETPGSLIRVDADIKGVLTSTIKAEDDVDPACKWLQSFCDPNTCHKLVDGVYVDCTPVECDLPDYCISYDDETDTYVSETDYKCEGGGEPGRDCTVVPGEGCKKCVLESTGARWRVVGEDEQDMCGDISDWEVDTCDSPPERLPIYVTWNWDSNSWSNLNAACDNNGGGCKCVFSFTCNEQTSNNEGNIEDGQDCETVLNTMGYVSPDGCSENDVDQPVGNKQIINISWIWPSRTWDSNYYSSICSNSTNGCECHFTYTCGVTEFTYFTSINSPSRCDSTGFSFNYQGCSQYSTGTASSTIYNNEQCSESGGCSCILSGEPASHVNQWYWCHDEIEGNINSGENCRDYDGCNCNGQHIGLMRYCAAPVLNDGEPCRGDNGLINGVWDNGQCVEREPVSDCLTGCTDIPTDCFNTGTYVYACDCSGNTFVCRTGSRSWVAYSNDPFGEDSNCTAGAGCTTTNARCLSDSGQLLNCPSDHIWHTQDELDSDFIIGATRIVAIEEGTQCLYEEDEYTGCECRKPYIVNWAIYNGEWCPEVSPSACYSENTVDTTDGPIVTHRAENVGKVCQRDGSTCNGDTAACDGEPPTASLYDLFETSNNLYSLLHQVYGSEDQETIYQDYIIDQSSGILSGLNAGTFTFTFKGESYLFTVTEEDLDINNGNLKIYLDLNANSQYDEGIDSFLSEYGSEIKIEIVNVDYTYNFKSGFNFVTFPFLVIDENARTASGMLDMLNYYSNDAAYSITKYDGTWNIVGFNGETYDNNDFQLVPGQGYIVKAKRPFSITISGSPVKFDTTTDSAPITLYTGWNLIGTYGSSVKQYTAKSLIQSINNYEPVDFTADNVSKWDSDEQKYEGYQLTVENNIDMEYGFDYPINSLQSYFVKILNGTGNWQQDIQD